MPSSPSTASVTPARDARSSSSATATSSSGRTGTAPSETTRPPDSSSERKSTSSISSRADSTSSRARSTSACTSSPGSVAVSSSDEQPRERRPQLVRDGGREARAQLLVGGHVAGLAEVDDPLAPAADLVRARSAARSRGRPRGGRREPARPRRSRRSTAGPAGSRAATVSASSSDDHGLAALLDQHPGAARVVVHRRDVLTERRRARAASDAGAEPGASFTTSLPSGHTLTAPGRPAAVHDLTAWRRS